jgi:hypothetical protein
LCLLGNGGPMVLAFGHVGAGCACSVFNCRCLLGARCFGAPWQTLLSVYCRAGCPSLWRGRLRGQIPTGTSPKAFYATRVAPRCLLPTEQAESAPLRMAAAGATTSPQLTPPSASFAAFAGQHLAPTSRFSGECCLPNAAVSDASPSPERRRDTGGPVASTSWLSLCVRACVLGPVTCPGSYVRHCQL